MVGSRCGPFGDVRSTDCVNGARSLEWHIQRAEVVHKKPRKQRDLRSDPRFAGLRDLELWELMNVQRPRPDHLGGAVKRELDRRALEAEHKAQTDPRATRSRVRERPHDGRSGGPPVPRPKSVNRADLGQAAGAGQPSYRQTSEPARSINSTLSAAPARRSLIVPS
jgi:hypothetical protein